jgi:hypothetical protein
MVFLNLIGPVTQTLSRYRAKMQIIFGSTVFFDTFYMW